MEFLLILFFISLSLNLIWEMLHCVLYDTCHELGLKKTNRLLVRMSLKDAFWIVIFYLVAQHLVEGAYAYLLVAAQALIFAFVIETHAMKTGRWKYGNKMPIALGVGLSPLVQLVITGIVSLYITNLVIL